ncbi:pectin lyase-like protein [Polyplosphaeria fusca]|uniref:Pectin lyase-like protein n=1 Tax=Polyplosphaeria fusca TaxID=682080 RepID=A0A9P4V7Q6_9PLEO|nr:pectin lyase-like protein [Polyplosphaeria fusca]
MHSLYLFLSNTLFFLTLGASSPQPSVPCTITVQSKGYEVYDDAPAINSAIRNCRSGTILLPEGQNFSIRSVVDFSPCLGCDIQLEGTLLMSDDWTAWVDKMAYIYSRGTRGLSIRSLTGKGVINGHAKGWYQRYHSFTVPDRWEYQAPLFLIENSKDVKISNIRLENAPREFFRVDGGNVGVHFTDLDIVVEDQWYQEVYTRWETSAFQFRNSSSISLSNINVAFSASPIPHPTTHGTGACVMLDWGLNDVSISDISCSGTFFGVMMQFGGVDMDKCIPPAPEEAQVSNNILIRNYLASSDHNAGFLHHFQYARPQIYNLTYDNVTFVSGAYLENSENYDWPLYCVYRYGVTQRWNFTDIWFKNLRGNLGVPNEKSPVFCKTYDCLNAWGGGVFDFHFEGIPVYTPSLK